MTKKLSASLALGLGVLLISFSAIFVRWANAPGSVTAFYRMGIAAGIMALPFGVHIRKPREAPDRRSLAIAVLAGLLFAADLTLWASGVVISGATTPTLLANTAPLWVGLGAWLLFGERHNARFWAGLGLALAGASLVLGQDLARGFDLGVGTFMGLLAAIFYGAYQLAAQRGRARLSTLSFFWIATTSAAAALLLLNLALGETLVGYSNFTYLNFFALGILAQVLGWLVINYAQGYLPASIVAPTLLIQPVGTAVIAALLLGERLMGLQFLGALGVLAGVFLVHRSSNHSS